jgi:hypothetical protein
MSIRKILFTTALSLTITACNKKADNSINYTAAVNSYYSAHPACLWSALLRFPIQVETSDQSKTMPYDALVDQGLLVRTTAEKKKLIVISKQVNNYDLSDQGHAAWTADTTEPGSGNFCYGHRKVSTIDSSTPTTDAVGATTTINYHYTLADVPAWANAAEIQTAYPNIRAGLAGPQAATATLTNTSNGWQVSTAPNGSHPATDADGRVVQ